MSFDQFFNDLKAWHSVLSICEVVDDASCQLSLKEIQKLQFEEVDCALRCRHREFGLKLLLAITFAARNKATEGQIWAAVRSGLDLSKEVEDRLFHIGTGQPRGEVKELIEKICRHFHLRHIFGQDGTQEWFGSIYLQFGFTQRGFTKMLPEWLMGYNQPNTIGRLLNDPELKSESFRKLWEALLSFRRGNAAEAVTRRIISESPWVVPGWADELLLAAKQKPHLSPSTYRSGSGEAGEAPRSFLSEPRLIVGNQLADAQWQIELAGLAEWALTGSSFSIRLRCGDSAEQEVFLRKQNDGSLSNLTHIFEFPLSSVKDSQVSASITDQQGHEVAAQDIHLFDPDSDIMAFGERGDFDDDFVKRGLRANTTCFILLRADLNLIPQSAEWHRFEGLGYRLYRVRFESGQQLRVLFEDGEELWSNSHRLSNDQMAPSFHSQLHCSLAPVSREQVVNPDVKVLKLEITGLNGAALRTARWRSHQLQEANDPWFEGNAENWGVLLQNVEQALAHGLMPVLVKVPKIEALLARKLTLNLA
jgi:hypothetical protein